MSSYWPSDLELSDTAAPMDILRDASEDWQVNSHGLLELIMQFAQSKSGNDMILVHARHIPSNRTASLLSVVSRPNNPYPARLQPKEDELPDFFKKTYVKQGVNTSGVGIQSALRSLQDLQPTATNHWIAETPSEFRTKLAEAFNLGAMKSIILNLVASDAPPATADDETAEESDLPGDSLDDSEEAG
jgi:hypothetical protein